MGEKKIGLAVIGAGQVVFGHMRDAVGTQHLELRVVCDSNPEMAERMAEEFGVTMDNVFTDYKEAINHPLVDAVVITTPNNLHYPIVMEAIRANKAYYLEKPVALNVEEAQEIYDATIKGNIKHMIGFSYRFYPALRYANHIVESGVLGEVNHFYAQYLQGLEEDIPRHWRYNKEIAGSGTLGDLGSHTIDTARLLVGEFDSVLATSGIFVKERPNPSGEGMLPVDTDDYFHIFTEMKNGASATFAFSKFAYGRFNYQRFEIYGKKGALVYNQERGEDKIELCTGELFKESSQFVSMNIPKQFKMTLMQGFENIMLGKDRSMAADIFDGLQVQKVLDAAQKSDEIGGWVSV